MNKSLDISVVELSRRALLKAAVLGLCAGGLSRLLPAASPAFAAVEAVAPRVLIVYYSLSGNTRALATLLHQRVGGDMVELETATPYPTEYRAVTEQAKRELESGFKPPLKTTVDNVDSYDVILVGSPCWWGTIATPVITFLSENKLAGKTVAPFMTHGGSGLGRSVAHIRELCPQATVREGLAVRGGRAASAGNEAEAWLAGLGLSR